MTDKDLKILKALMFGKVAADDIYARFVVTHADLSSLITSNLIAFDGSYYRLTVYGREKIPKQTIQSNKPATLTLKQIESSFTKYEVPEFKGEKNVSETKKLMLGILEYIEQNPNCEGSDLTKAGFIKASARLAPYIAKGGILVKGKRGSGHKPKYCLAEGMTANDVYTKSAAEINKMQAKSVNEIKVYPELSQPIIGRTEIVKHTQIENDDEETVIAYDSHKRLSIDSIELTPKQTSELLIFIHDLGLVN